MTSIIDDVLTLAPWLLAVAGWGASGYFKWLAPHRRAEAESRRSEERSAFDLKRDQLELLRQSIDQQVNLARAMESTVGQDPTPSDQQLNTLLAASRGRSEEHQAAVASEVAHIRARKDARELLPGMIDKAENLRRREHKMALELTAVGPFNNGLFVIKRGSGGLTQARRYHA